MFLLFFTRATPGWSTWPGLHGQVSQLVWLVKHASGCLVGLSTWPGEPTGLEHGDADAVYYGPGPDKRRNFNF